MDPREEWSIGEKKLRLDEVVPSSLHRAFGVGMDQPLETVKTSGPRLFDAVKTSCPSPLDAVMTGCPSPLDAVMRSCLRPFDSAGLI